MIVELNSLWAVIDATLIIGCAYSAGKMRAALEIDAAEGNPTNWPIFGLWLTNLAFAVYFAIALYGYGLARAS